MRYRVQDNASVYNNMTQAVRYVFEDTQISSTHMIFLIRLICNGSCMATRKKSSTSMYPIKQAQMWALIQYPALLLWIAPRQAV